MKWISNVIKYWRKMEGERMSVLRGSTGTGKGGGIFTVATPLIKVPMRGT